MNILFINEFGESEVKSVSAVPKSGDKVDMSYEPLPTVSMVLWYPSPERIRGLGRGDQKIEAIVTVR